MSTTTTPAIIPAYTTQSLAKRASELVMKDDLTYLEAIIAICDETGIDPQDMAKLVAGSLKSKIEVEARRNNILAGGTSNTLAAHEA